MEASVVFGVVTTTGTPPEVINALNAAINQLLKVPGQRKALIDLGADPTTIGGTVAQYDDALRTERQKWSEIVKVSGAKVD